MAEKLVNIVKKSPTVKKCVSRKAAIDEMCRSCIYDPMAKGMGTWRQQVEDCKSDGIDGRSKCPLWDFRPVSLETSRANSNPNHHFSTKEKK